MIRVGVIGLGSMGLTHLGIYCKRNDIQVVAISDRSPERMDGASRASGNIEGLAQTSFDFATAKKYEDGLDLIKDRAVDLVDVCVPTPLHLELGKEVLKRGKHLLIEKPLARTSKDAYKLARIAEKAKGLAMPAQCMRFWPGWTWLKDAVANRTYGAVRAASFRRVSSHPGGPIYASGELSGGAALDLHIHDTDFIQYCFGKPRAVASRGYSKLTTAVDHLVTHYHYDDIPLVMAEGGWCMSPGFGFRMQYTVNFEHATAEFDFAAPQPLRLVRDGHAQPVELPPGMGYEHEIGYFLDCIARGVRPEIVTLPSAALSVAIVEAEVKSVTTGKPVRIR